MDIIIKTKNLEHTDYLENLVHKKMGALGRLIKNENVGIFIELEKETNHHKKGDIFVSKIIINLPGKKLNAKFHCDNLVRSITETKKEMEREIRKYKSKKIEIPIRKAKKVSKLN